MLKHAVRIQVIQCSMYTAQNPMICFSQFTQVYYNTCSSVLQLDDVEVFLGTLSTPQAVVVAERLVLQVLEVSCAEFVRLAITGVKHLMSRGFQALSGQCLCMWYG